MALSIGLLQRAVFGMMALWSPVAISGASDGGKPLVIQRQGSFAVGGTVTGHPGTFNPHKPGPEGQTLHGDHAYVSYQIPVKPRPLPLVFLHGAGQFSKTWETTPDGREGFRELMLRQSYSVYLVDQPRRGGASRSTQSFTIHATPDEQTWFNLFRLGTWPNLYPGVQFSQDPEALNQFFRQMVPNAGPFDMDVISDAMSALFTKTGPGILVTHSQGGGPGWLTAMKSANVRGIVAFEPGSGFMFPEGEVPPAMPSSAGPLEGVAIPLKQFLPLTKIPIVLFYGDNIPDQPTDFPGQDNWRVRLKMARLWRDAVNRHGGDVTVVHLPEIGIRGNTHFLFSDLNNRDIAEQMTVFFKKKRLD
ncbi:MAG: alpha/beta fold hydrolase [Acidobacteria bacterium]|nr:alpha/beta fold hydrolase [Acidobacteriota bacterium]MBI3489481.1 alpha/beta fold hydrolase [Acidobacteriota bacterium]